MKKLVLVLTMLAIALPLSPASADVVCTRAGCVTVDDSGYLVAVDGEAANPGPASGFVSITYDGKVCTDDNGSPDDGYPSNGPESDHPTCTS